MQGAVTVTFKAQMDELITGMQQAGAITQQAAEQMREELGLLGKESEHAGAKLDEFVHHIRTMRKEAFLGNFMAREIASVGIASKETAGMLTGMFAAFAIGGPIGIAIETVKILFETIHKIGEEADAAAAELVKFGTDATAAAASVREEVNKMLMSLEGASKADMLFHDKVVPALKEEADLKQAAIKAQQALSEAEVKAKAYVKEELYQSAADQAAAMAVYTKNEREAVEKSNTALEAKKQLLEELNAQVKRLGEGEEKADKKKEAVEEQNAEITHNAKMLELRAQLATGQEKIQLEFYAKAAALRARDNTTEEQDEEEIFLLKRKMLIDIAKDREDAHAKMLAADQKWHDANIKAEYKESEALKKYFADKENERLKQMEEKDKKIREKFDEMAKAAESMGKAFGNSIADMVSDTQSFTQAMSSMVRQVLGMVIEMVIKSVTAKAADAAAGAAASQSAIPIIGPALAIGAMAAMLTAVTGLLTSGPRASGGYDIPSGINPIVQAHGGEMILPRQYADVIRGMVGGGGGGKQMHLHFPNALFVDRRGLEQLAQDPHFVSGFVEGRRNGVIPG